ncbi:hypothetical protein O181_036708 [Austropuccinia psidii MF-1]|uniref:Uncharacterized protein n=1 Tax=Austropuccinia psidii MF-1 TaxID=1389203 RepID=A0A9Q3D9Z2_9BASI|nr:hypothetical protein [Austropuccinia psidii MF-1]
MPDGVLENVRMRIGGILGSATGNLAEQSGSGAREPINSRQNTLGAPAGPEEGHRVEIWILITNWRTLSANECFGEDRQTRESGGDSDGIGWHRMIPAGSKPQRKPSSEGCQKWAFWLSAR